MLKDPSLEGLFFFQKHPIRMPTVWGTDDGGGVLAESLGKSYLWAVGFFFGNTELSLQLWTIIAGISGFDD